MKFNVDPTAEVSKFTPVKAGTYTLRIEDVEQKVGQESGNAYLSWRLAITTPKEELIGLDGATLEGSPSSVFLSTSLADGKQGFVRALVEAAGGVWDADFDTNDILGKEISAVLDEDEYNGKIKNVVKSILNN